MDPREEVEHILTDCFITLGQSLHGMRVSHEAARFWRQHYHRLFLGAMSDGHPRSWAKDRRNVLAKARDLGRRAAELATLDGTDLISATHAEVASRANDCKPRSRYSMFSYWCAPRPSAEHLEAVAARVAAEAVPARARFAWLVRWVLRPVERLNLIASQSRG